MRNIDWRGMWAPELAPWEVALRAAIVYLVLQLLVRLTGPKAVSRYSTADIVLIFLISQAIRQTIVGNDTSLTNGLVALATLFLLDWLLTLLTSRCPKAAHFAQGEVRQLVREGHIVEDVLHRYHISEGELLAQVRQHHRSSLAEVQDAYLERSGQISIVFKTTDRST